MIRWWAISQSRLYYPAIVICAELDESAMRLFVEKLTSIDSSYFCPERGIVGESWLLDVELGGELNEQQMLFDFADVKRTIKRYVDQAFDHKLLLPKRDQGIQILASADGQVVLSLDSKRGRAYLVAPDVALTWIDQQRVDGTALSAAIAEGLRALLPANVVDIVISLRHEEATQPYFHYSHGLRNHGGNCQRIAHGHRSRLRISRNGVFDEALTRRWCSRWQDIYLAHDVDLVNWSATPFAAYGPDEGFSCFSYVSGQGFFAIAVPTSWCEVVTVDTTIEQIAGYIAATVGRDFPGDVIEVRVYEGVEKGAVATVGQ